LDGILDKLPDRQALISPEELIQILKNHPQSETNETEFDIIEGKYEFPVWPKRPGRLPKIKASVPVYTIAVCLAASILRSRTPPTDDQTALLLAKDEHLWRNTIYKLPDNWGDTPSLESNGDTLFITILNCGRSRSGQWDDTASIILHPGKLLQGDFRDAFEEFTKKHTRRAGPDDDEWEEREEYIDTGRGFGLLRLTGRVRRTDNFHYDYEYVCTAANLVDRIESCVFLLWSPYLLSDPKCREAVEFFTRNLDYLSERRNRYGLKG
jgi:hypothetical protein